MIHIEKNPVLSDTEHLITVKFHHQVKNDLHFALQGWLHHIEGTTTTLNVNHRATELYNFLCLNVQQLNQQHGRCKPLRVIDLSFVDTIFRICTDTWMCDVILIPISGRLDIDQSLNSKVNP